MNILTVDDNATNRKLLRAVLEADGHTVIEAHDGVEALEALQREKVDVIISDILMPRMDGYRLCYEVRGHERFRNLPIIVYTATYTAPSDEKLSLEMGADLFLKNPASASEIAHALEEVTRGPLRAPVMAGDPSVGMHLMKEYNEVLVAKLEEKTIQLSENIRLASLIADVSTALSHAVSLPAMLRVCMGALVRHLDAACSGIWTLMDAEATLELAASACGGRETAPIDLPAQIPVGQGQIGMTAHERKPHLTNDLLNDPLVVDKERMRREGITACASYPLLVGERLVGVVVVYARTSLRESALQALGSVANQIALGIERVRANERYRRAQERLQYVVSSSPAVLFALAVEGEAILGISWMSPNIAQMLGYAAEETFGSDWWMGHVHPDDLKTVMAEVQRRLFSSGQVANEYRFLRKDGDYRWVRSEIRLLRDASGQPREAVGSWSDITPARQLAAERDALLSRLQLYIQRLPLAYVLFDADLRICDWNPAAERMFGYARDEMLGHGPPYEKIVPSTVWDRIADSVLRRIRAGEMEAHSINDNLTKGGRTITCHWINTPLTDDAGRFTGFLSLAEDVTARLILEEQFRQAQKMESIGQLAGGVAHDFNNLLTVINGYSDIIHEQLPSESPMRDMVAQISQAGERATHLTRQLLAFSRKQVLEPKVLDLNVVIAGTVKMLKRLLGEDLDLQTIFDPRLWPVKADAGQIEQVLINLAVNARDAMPTGGRLTIETCNTQLDETYTQAYADLRPGTYVLLAVADTGTGMDAATKARVFEPYFTTKELGKGTGLGLATVFGIIKQSGGHIAVYSELGLGTTFKVYLPAIENLQVASDLPLAGPKKSWRGSETILVVEDEPGLRRFASHILAEQGYQILETGNGKQALQMAQAHAGPIHLVVTDVVMPHMSGRQLAEQLGALRPELRVLYVSGYTDDAVIRHGVLQAQAAFLQKPFTPDGLAAKVRDVLDRPVPERVSPAAPGRAGATILVIDDDQRVLDFLQAVFEEEGYAVVRANNGVAGVREYRRQPTDLVICDIFMDGQDGLQTIRELCTEFPRVRIIAISGGSTVAHGDYLVHARQFGALETYYKPLERDSLLAMVRKVLGW